MSINSYRRFGWFYCIHTQVPPSFLKAACFSETSVTTGNRQSVASQMTLSSKKLWRRHIKKYTTSFTNYGSRITGSLSTEGHLQNRHPTGWPNEAESSFLFGVTVLAFSLFFRHASLSLFLCLYLYFNHFPSISSFSLPFFFSVLISQSLFVFPSFFLNGWKFQLL